VAAAPDRFETVAWVYDQGELAILLSLFAHEDIRVVPVGRGHISVQWGWTVALGGVAILVHAEDGRAARALLAGIERTPRQRTRFFAKDRLVDVLLVLVGSIWGSSPRRRASKPNSPRYGERSQASFASNQIFYASLFQLYAKQPDRGLP